MFTRVAEGTVVHFCSPLPKGCESGGWRPFWPVGLLQAGQGCVCVCLLHTERFLTGQQGLHFH